MFAYVSCAEDRRILVLAISAADGAMATVQEVEVPGSDAPSPSNMPLAFDPGRRRLNAALRSGPCAVTCFARDAADGRLTPSGTTPLGDPMAYVAVDRTGRHLLCASYKAGTVAVFPIAGDGRVGAEPTFSLRGQPKAHCILQSRSSGAVHAAVLGRDEILHFDLSGGVLTPISASPTRTRPGVGPRHLARHPALDVLYAINEHEGSIDVYAGSGTDEAPTHRQTASLMPPGFGGNARAADLHVTADGRFVFASIRTTDSVAGFATDASGLLTSTGSWPVGGSPRGFAASPDSRFLLVGSQTLDAVELYRITEAGRLDLVSRLGTARNPSWIEIVPATPA